MTAPSMSSCAARLVRQVEFGNKLWIGENRVGIIVNYEFYQRKPSASKLVESAIQRLFDHQHHSVKNVWGDRGLARKINTILLVFCFYMGERIYGGH